MSVALVKDIRSNLAENLYATASAADFDLSPAMRESWEALRKSWDNLEFDKYYGDSSENYRKRRYSDFVYNPKSGDLRLMSHVPYFQSKAMNEYVGGVVRHFGDVLPEVYENAFFKQLVQYDFGLFNIDEEYLDRDWICQVHQIRIVVGAGNTTDVTPEGIHSDGYPFAAVHFVGREHVSGGQSSVYTFEDEREMATLTFLEPLDSLFLEDRKIKHYVTPISADTDHDGYREILAVSFSLPDSPYTTLV